MTKRGLPDPNSGIVNVMWLKYKATILDLPNLNDGTVNAI